MRDSDDEHEGLSRRSFVQGTAAAAGIGLTAPWLWSGRSAGAQAATIVDPRFTAPVIDPAAIPKFAAPLPVPGILDLTATANATIQVQPVTVPVLPAPLPATPVWAYRNAGVPISDTFLGPTIVARQGLPVAITYDYSPVPVGQHRLQRGNPALGSVVDKTLHGTNGMVGGTVEPEVRFIAHLHGSEGVAPGSDGYAEAWVTPDGKTYQDFGYAPPVANQATLTYPNTQTATLLWYHDHALGNTRLNVYAGLAGGYVLRDANETSLGIPLGPPFEVPLVIQDRMFYPDGRLAYPDQTWLSPAGFTPFPAGEVSILPEFFGDVMIVNGRTWPFLEVLPTTYRLRFLNGCNSRFLDLELKGGGRPLPFVILGTEGGFLNAPVRRSNLVMGPAERFDVIVDFSGLAGQTLTLTNKGAKKPFPKGTPPRPQIDGQVMQIRVLNAVAPPPIVVPTVLRATPITLPNPLPAARRRLLLFEGMDQYGRIQPLLGTVSPAAGGTFTGQPLPWEDPVTETPFLGATEVWEFYNTTADAHPVHVHEVLFQVVDRQPIKFSKKMGVGVTGIQLQGRARPREAYETGHKDTVIAYPGEVTRVVATFGSGGRFVWHCHILEHEDHEMMRPYDIL